MIVVLDKKLYLDGEYSDLVAEASGVVNEIAKALAEKSAITYENALQIIIGSIHGICRVKYELDKNERRS